MTRCPTATIALALAGLLVATDSAAAVGTIYDDARVTGVSVIASNPADQAGPMTFYEKSKLKVACKYEYAQSLKKTGIPQGEVRLYARGSGGGHFVFSTQKLCYSQSCTMEGALPANLGTGSAGSFGIGCEFTMPDGSELKDAIVANNKKEVLITVVPPPKKPTGLMSTDERKIACPKSLGAWLDADLSTLNPQDLQSPPQKKKIVLALIGSGPVLDTIQCNYGTAKETQMFLNLKCNEPKKDPQQLHTYRCKR
jgi:hypothetical protein